MLFTFWKHEGVTHFFTPKHVSSSQRWELFFFAFNQTYLKCGFVWRWHFPAAVAWFLFPEGESLVFQHLPGRNLLMANRLIVIHPLKIIKFKSIFYYPLDMNASTCCFLTETLRGFIETLRKFNKNLWLLVLCSHCTDSKRCSQTHQQILIKLLVSYVSSIGWFVNRQPDCDEMSGEGHMTKEVS